MPTHTQKETETNLGHQKSPKGAPKAPKRLTEVTKKVHIFDQKVDLGVLHGI